MRSGAWLYAWLNGLTIILPETSWEEKNEQKKKYNLYSWEFQCFIGLYAEHMPAPLRLLTWVWVFVPGGWQSWSQHFSFHWPCQCTHTSAADAQGTWQLCFFLFFFFNLLDSFSVYKLLRFIPDFIFTFCIHFLGKMVKEDCDKETGQLLSFHTIQSLTVGHPLGRFVTLDGQLSSGQRSNLIWKLVLIFNLLTW